MLKGPCKDWEGHIISICGQDFIIDKITPVEGGYTIETTALKNLTVVQKCVAFLWKRMAPSMLRLKRYCDRSSHVNNQD